MKNKLLAMLLLFSIFIFVFTGCKTRETSQQQQVYYIFTDSLNNTVQLDEQPQRIVSLMGSYSQTWDLAGGKLAGTTDDAISERNMQLEEDTKIVGTVKNPNLEEIINLQPDFVLLSADIASHTNLAQSLEQLGISHAFFKVESFTDYLNMLKICTDITGRQDLYQQNGLQVQKQIEEVMGKVPQEEKPAVLLLRAFSTGVKAKGADTVAGKIIEDLGCQNIINDKPSLLDELSIEEIIQQDPAFIFVVTMGSDSEKAIQYLKSSLESNPAWSELSAVKNGRYIVLPKELFHYKPNVQWGRAYEYLFQILYA